MKAITADALIELLEAAEAAARELERLSPYGVRMEIGERLRLAVEEVKTQERQP